MFVEHVLGGDTTGLNISPSASASVRDAGRGMTDRR